MRRVVPIDHNAEKPKGILKIVAETVICKPKIERLTLSNGVKPEDLKDFVGPKEFLQRYQGVKQKIATQKLREKQAIDREARTYHHAGIDIQTKSGLVTLTREMAKQLKTQMDNQEIVQFIDEQHGGQTNMRICRPYESPRAEVNELDRWEAEKFGDNGGYESD